MPINPAEPVILRKMVVDPKTGNTYIARSAPYQPGELPLYLLTDANCLNANAPIIVAEAVASHTIETSTPEYKATEVASKELVPTGLSKKTVAIGTTDSPKTDK